MFIGREDVKWADSCVYLGVELKAGRTFITLAETDINFVRVSMMLLAIVISCLRSLYLKSFRSNVCQY